MTIREIRENLFSFEKTHYLAHCISSDCAMGAGIAVEFERKYKLRSQLQSKGHIIWPTTVLIGKIFNLITKARYWEKPTYETMRVAVHEMRLLCEKNEVKKLAMPKIGCGLDRLHWGAVKAIIEEEFKDLDIEIVVCYL